MTRSRVLNVLAPLCRYSGQPQPEIHTLLDAFAEISAGCSQFDESERVLLHALGLDCLGQSVWWSRLVTVVARSGMPDDIGADLVRLCARLQFIADGFPAMKALLEAPAPPLEADAGGIALIFPGSDGVPPSLARIASAIKAVDAFWMIVEDLAGQQSALQMAAAGAGYGMSLRFDGAPGPLEELRLLLVSVWDVAARVPELPADQRAALLPDMLPVMDRINRSHAERIRPTIEKAIRHLLEAECALLGTPARRSAGNDPATVAASHLPVQAAALRADPLPNYGLSFDDMSHLATVIAEERSQLRYTAPTRRMWQGNASTD